MPGGFPSDISTTGYWVDRLFWLALWLTGIAFAIILGVLAYFLIRDRARPDRRAYYLHRYCICVIWGF